MIPLPIDSVTPRIVAALRDNCCAVLKAPAGAGKSTRVPAALLDSGILGGGTVLVLQPRRVAARAVARRIAEERGGRIGDEVGYHIRFDRQTSGRTRLIVLTEGLLVRRLQADPFLEGVAAVVLDEFHERHLETDVSLGMCRRIQQTVRPDLRLLVMSATLAAEPISKFLGGCPILECDVAAHPVQVRYQAVSAHASSAVSAAHGAAQMLCESAGDVLVFLPGTREIRQTEQELLRLVDRNEITVLPLYGDLPASEQDRVFAPCRTRKVVLATNVAETSLTIPGITAVVDTGTARVLEYDANLGLNRLQLRSISQASADQRTGRAGRTAPGLCLRLWPEAAHRHRPVQDTAEIHRVDLSGVVLQLLDWGETDLLAFPWYDPPDTAAIEQATVLLRRLGAVADDGLTPLGRNMARLPVPPRLARLVLAGAASGQLQRAALIAALLSGRDPFVREERSGPARHHSRSDVLDRVDAFLEFSRSRRTHFDLGTLKRGAAEVVRATADQLQRYVREIDPAPDLPVSSHDDDEPLLKAILAAFPDRLVRRREPASRRGVMVGGRGVRQSDQSAVIEGDLFVCVEADAGAAGTAESLVRLASLVERDWLTGPPAGDAATGANLQVRVDVEFDNTQRRVQARRRVSWDGLVLDEAPAPLPGDEQVANVLAAAAATEWERVFPADNARLCGFLARVRCLAEWMPEQQLPCLDDRFLKALLPELCAGRRSFVELQKAPWLDLVQSRLTGSQLQLIEREAPERIQVPSGSRRPIQYEPGRPPVLAVRIQEVFGWQATPRIAGGRIPLLLHLLAPNDRPQQITDDLQSFWANAYPIIRGELRRRYPRHAWPDDPCKAAPERRPSRR